MADLSPTSPETQQQYEVLVGFLRQVTSTNTRLARAKDLGVPLEWVPGYTPAAPESPRQGRPRRARLAWLHWCLDQQLPLAAVGPSDVERWLAELSEAGYANSSRGRMLSTVSAFYKYLLREDIVERNPADGALINRRGHHLNRTRGVSDTAALSLRQCRALLEAAWLLADKHEHGRRDRAMVELLIGTGIRADELVGINLNDLRLGAGDDAVRVHGKGGHDRLIALPGPVADAIADYLDTRLPSEVPALHGTTPAAARAEPVFLTNAGNRVHPSHIERLLRRICATFAPRNQPRRRWHRELLDTTQAGRIATELRGIRDTLHPHQLRHAYATNAADRGVNPRQIQRDLGHAEIATTEGYLHNAHSVRDSAAHDLSPALHRGWLTTQPSTTSTAAAPPPGPDHREAHAENQR